MPRFCTGQGSGGEFCRWDLERTVPIVCPDEAGRGRKKQLYVLKGLADEGGEFAVAEGHSKALIDRLQGIRTTLLDYTNVVLWLNRYCRSNSTVQRGMRERYMRLASEIARAKRDQNAVLDDSSTDGSEDVGFVMSDQVQDQGAIARNRERILDSVLDLEVDEEELDAQIHSTDTDHPLLLRHSMGHKIGLKQKDNLVNMPTAQREFFTELFGRMFLPMRVASAEIGRLRRHLNSRAGVPAGTDRYREACREDLHGAAKRVAGSNDFEERYRTILEVHRNGDNTGASSPEAGARMDAEDILRIVRHGDGRLRATGPTYIQDAFRQAFIDHAGLKETFSGPPNRLVSSLKKMGGKRTPPPLLCVCVCARAHHAACQ